MHWLTIAQMEAQVYERDKPPPLTEEQLLANLDDQIETDSIPKRAAEDMGLDFAREEAIARNKVAAERARINPDQPKPEEVIEARIN